MVNCLPEPGLLSPSLFVAPLLLVRGVRRRVSQWIVIHHQRCLQKLSVRRRRHQSLGNRQPRPYSEPLVARMSPCLEKTRPHSEPSMPVPLLKDSEEMNEVDLEVHVSVINVPVKPLLVLSDNFSSIKAPPVALITRTLSDTDEEDLSGSLEAIPFSPMVQKARPGLCTQTATNLQSREIKHRPFTLTNPQLSQKISSQHSEGNQESESLLTKELLPLENGENLVLSHSLYKNIMEKPYFHLISRATAKLMMMEGEDGMFLIRPSTHSGEPLTLTFKLDNRPYNISIRQRPDSLFALGTEKRKEKTFSSIDELVRTYTTKPIKLQNGKVAFLKSTPPKKDTPTSRKDEEQILLKTS